MTFIDRYVSHRESLRALLRRTRPDHLGIEFPVFDQLWSEGCYGLFLYCCEAVKEEGYDVVFWSPGQIKAHARALIERPPKWYMDKPDMVEAAKADTGGGRWDHNEADAYLCARLSGRFWEFHEGVLAAGDLTATEAKYFNEIKRPLRGKDAGREIRRGVIHREDERFFMWSRDVSDGDDVTATAEGEG